MKKIAYLASRDTLPDSPCRRADAFEHDESVAALHGPFRAEGLEICPLAWDDPKVDWSIYAAAIIGTTWDYSDRKEEFLFTLERIEARTRLYNPVAQVRWNSSKTYLRELANKGVATIPTLWLDHPTPAVFDELRCDDLVFKRQVTAGAIGQHRLKRGDPFPTMPDPMMVQPFLNSIQKEGELSFIFIDGQLSHTLLKRASDQDYRVQSLYGGYEVAAQPSAADGAAAAHVMSVLEEIPLYARVDMIRGREGELLLMELEIIEPFLYPEQGPDLGPRMARAIAARIL